MEGLLPNPAQFNIFGSEREITIAYGRKKRILQRPYNPRPANRDRRKIRFPRQNFETLWPPS